jgi:hypothetical protein
VSRHQTRPADASRPPYARATRTAERDAETLATVAAGRAATVTRLRALATRLEALPLDAAAAVLVLLEPALAGLERQAALALERAPAGRL